MAILEINSIHPVLSHHTPRLKMNQESESYNKLQLSNQMDQKKNANSHANSVTLDLFPSQPQIPCTSDNTPRKCNAEHTHKSPRFIPARCLQITDISPPSITIVNSFLSDTSPLRKNTPPRTPIRQHKPSPHASLSHF